jgi:GDP-L-fucose synthase
MKILVLGSTGFVGKNLVEHLRKNKHDVVTAERSSGTDLRIYKNVLHKIKEGQPDIIYNLASHGGSVHYVRSKAAEVFHDNVQMALNLYKAVSEVNPKIKIIQPFSNCSYPGTSNVQKEEEWLDGDVHPSVFSFGNAKRTIFYISKCYKEQHGVRSVNFLFPNTYGPGDSEDPNHTHALNGMIIRMLKAKQARAKEFVVWGTGSPIREWAYIDDFIDTLVNSMELEGLEYPLNMGQEKGYSIAESAKTIKDVCGFEGEIIFDTSYQDGDPVKIMSKNKFIKTFKGFKFHNHREGIINTIEYYDNIFNGDK